MCVLFSNILATILEFTCVCLVYSTRMLWLLLDDSESILCCLSLYYIIGGTQEMGNSLTNLVRWHKAVELKIREIN